MNDSDKKNNITNNNTNKSNIDNGNRRPQYYAERRLPLFEDGAGITSGLVRAGWSHGNNKGVSMNNTNIPSLSATSFCVNSSYPLNPYLSCIIVFSLSFNFFIASLMDIFSSQLSSLFLESLI